MSKMVVFCTKGNVIFNSSGDLEVVEKKKSTKNKNIKNHIFESMRKINSDPFWDSFLIKASRNSFPSGFSFRDNVLFFSQKPRSNYELVLNDTDIEKSFEDLRKFMMQRGIISDSDQAKIDKEFDNRPLPQPILVDNWKDLGKLQTDVIYDYKLELKERYKLSNKEFLSLTSVVNIGLSSGVFNENNITVEKSKIIDIQPLKYQKSESRFFIDSNEVKVKKQRPKDINSTVETSTTCNTISTKVVNNISKNWENFVHSVLYKNI